MSKPHSQQEIIDAYLHYYRTKKEEYWWAYQDIVDIIESPDCLPFVLALIHACHNDAEIAYVAAGPLEDLLNKHHEKIKDSLSELVRSDEKMRKAIQGVWIGKGKPSRKTLDEILAKYNLTYGSL
jgi:hypothetical protein